MLGHFIQPTGRKVLSTKTEHGPSPENDPDDATLFAGFLQPEGAYYTPEVWLDCRPETTYSYSNTGYDLLGHVVEQASGRHLNDYLREEIFEPLGMSHTARLSEDPPYPQATPTEHVYWVCKPLAMAGHTIRGSRGSSGVLSNRTNRGFSAPSCS